MKQTEYFFNAKAFEKEEDEHLKAFLAYICGKETKDNFVDKLGEKIFDIKTNKKWRIEFMTLYTRELENFEDGIQEGIKLGILNKELKKVKSKVLNRVKHVEYAKINLIQLEI